MLSRRRVTPQQAEMRVIAEALPATRQTLLFSATMTASLVAMQEHALPDAFHFQVPCATDRHLNEAFCASSVVYVLKCITVTWDDCMNRVLMVLTTAGIRGTADSVKAAAGVCVHTLQGQGGVMRAQSSSTHHLA